MRWPWSRKREARGKQGDWFDVECPVLNDRLGVDGACFAVDGHKCNHKYGDGGHTDCQIYHAYTKGEYSGDLKGYLRCYVEHLKRAEAAREEKPS